MVIDPMTIGMGVAGLMGYKLLTAAVDIFVRKFLRNDFITQEQFDHYNKKRVETEDLIKQQLSELRAMTTIIAIKTGSHEDDISKLVKGC